MLNYVIGFVVSLLIGAFGIYVGARVIADRSDYEYAIITALIGSFVWWVITGLFGLIPFVGGFIGALLALFAWIYIINARYPGGWGSAIGIALVAWIAVWAVLVVLNVLGFLAAGALGVPGF
ncbi:MULTISPECIES: hypothetical protein [Halorussus]|uniref:hypothetical protein n=1 Tax=Halorussus TaxID=1070314 RepID=UPI0034A36E2A